MNFKSEVLSSSQTEISNLLPEIGKDEMRKEICTGLECQDKFISSKYFYNEKGSALFEEITQQDEYYPTRTERSILRNIAAKLINSYSDYDILELGSGDCSKISILFDSIPEGKSFRYIPTDVSQSAILDSAENLYKRYDDIYVEAYVADFITQFNMVQRENPVLVCFFGSTIGNFEHRDSIELIKNIGESMKKGDVLLLGMDMVKSESRLNAAYNDEKGVTSAFNKNILNTVNDLIESDFNPDDFMHQAFYNNDLSRIEMHLEAKRDLFVGSVYFESDLFIRKGERIHTENSHKYREKDIHYFAYAAGLSVKEVHTDDHKWFSLVEFEK